MGSPIPVPLYGNEPLPTLAEAQQLAMDLLQAEGTRLPHVRTAGRVATRLHVLFEDDEAQLLIVAASLHDIGYSRRIRRTGFHPLDGAEFLRAEGYPEMLVRLVANHSLATLTAGPHLGDLLDGFPAVPGLLSDALAYADMHSAPDGRLIRVEQRLADIATRHRDPAEAHRANELRLAMARVGEALLAIPTPVPPASPGEHVSAAPPRQHAAQAGLGEVP